MYSLHIFCGKRGHLGSVACPATFSFVPVNLSDDSLDQGRFQQRPSCNRGAMNCICHDVHDGLMMHGCARQDQLTRSFKPFVVPSWCTSVQMLFETQMTRQVVHFNALAGKSQFELARSLLPTSTCMMTIHRQGTPSQYGLVSNCGDLLP